jgi:hypothetical protein
MGHLSDVRNTKLLTLSIVWTNKNGLSFHNHCVVEQWSLLHVDLMDACEEDQIFPINSSADDMIFSLDGFHIAV